MTVHLPARAPDLEERLAAALEDALRLEPSRPEETSGHPQQASASFQGACDSRQRVQRSSGWLSPGACVAMGLRLAAGRMSIGRSLDNIRTASHPTVVTGLKAIRHAAASFVARLASARNVLLEASPMPPSDDEARVRLSIQRHLILGGAVALLLVGGVGSWAATIPLSGAVIAAGHLVVDSSVKSVQHPNGGIVGELNVRDGQQVEADEVLIRLDDTATRANLGIITKSLDELAANRARLLAERDGLDAIVLPEKLNSRPDDPRVADLVAGEERLFSLRREAHDGQKAQLTERIAQLEEEVRGISAQEAAKAEEIRIVSEEVEGVRELWEKKLVQRARVSELERAAARLKGEHGQLMAAISQARGRISETSLQIIQLDQDFRSQVASELAEVEAKIAELEERKVAAEDQLKRTDIRAPQAGWIHQLTAHTVGGVISPGQVVMQIVPSSDELMVEVRVAPQDINQLRPGQTAVLRLSALNQHTTPEIEGQVRRISPDIIADDRSGAPYYRAHIALAEADLRRLGEVDLVPGMPVEAFIRTADRTFLSYLLKPLNDQISRAFREE